MKKESEIPRTEAEQNCKSHDPEDYLKRNCDPEYLAALEEHDGLNADNHSKQMAICAEMGQSVAIGLISENTAKQMIVESRHELIEKQNAAGKRPTRKELLAAGMFDPNSYDVDAMPDY